MMKSGNRSDRAKQHRKFFHLLENLHSQQVALDPAVEKRVSGGLTVAELGPAHRARRRAGISEIRSLHDFEQNFEISHTARHWANHPEQREWSDRLRKVSAGRNASGSWLQPADSTKMSGD